MSSNIRRFGDESYYVLRRSYTYHIRHDSYRILRCFHRYHAAIFRLLRDSYMYRTGDFI